MLNGQADLFENLNADGSHLEVRDANGLFHTAIYSLPQKIPSVLQVNVQLLQKYSLSLDYYTLEGETKVYHSTTCELRDALGNKLGTFSNANGPVPATPYSKLFQKEQLLSISCADDDGELEIRTVQGKNFFLRGPEATIDLETTVLRDTTVTLSFYDNNGVPNTERKSISICADNSC